MSQQPSSPSSKTPRHLLPPGQDGYRTPTIEDSENHFQYFPNYNSNLGNRSRSKSSLATPPIPENEKAESRLELEYEKHLTWKQRIRHFTWSFFTLTMATGGMANVLYSVPLRFRGLETIGLIFFLANMVFYVILWTMISFRFYFYPRAFKDSLTHPTESLFVPATVVSFGTILINISQYGVGKAGDWLNEAVCVMFWIDSALAVIFSAGIYLLVWSTTTFTIAKMTPVWIFPAYPLLIIGPHAGILSATLKPTRAFDIIIGGVTLQGIGFLVSLMVYSAFIYRLMTQKLPRETLRPGMFVSVGPSAFTVAGIVNMAESLQKAIPDGFMGDGKLTATILKVVADWMSLWLWGLAIWFFFISVFAHWSCVGHGKLQFAMTWFSFVFPNTALITATFAIAKAFGSHAIEVIGCVMTCLLMVTYFFVFGMMIRAVILHQILWPEMGEDKSEGGFTARQEPDEEAIVATGRENV